MNKNSCVVLLLGMVIGLATCGRQVMGEEMTGNWSAPAWLRKLTLRTIRWAEAWHELANRQGGLLGTVGGNDGQDVGGGAYDRVRGGGHAVVNRPPNPPVC